MFLRKQIIPCSSKIADFDCVEKLLPSKILDNFQISMSPRELSKAEQMCRSINSGAVKKEIYLTFFRRLSLNYPAK